MIETRYSIEYIDPSSNKVSSKLGKFLIYSILTISILAAIAALIFSNLPKDTSQVITDKVQQFVSSFNEPSANTPIEEQAIISEPEAPVVEIPAIATEEQNKQEADKNEALQQKMIATKLNDEYKKEIDRLSQENATQHNESVKQLTANQALTKKLDTLSKQLKSETEKSELLKKEVTSLQTKNKTVADQLKKTEEIAKNYADKIKTLEQKEVKVVTQSATINPVISEPIETKKIKKKEPEKALISEVKEATEDTSTSNKNNAPTSQMDAIVAAMEAAKSTPNNQVTETSSLPAKE